MQNNVNSNISWYEGQAITSLGKISKFSTFYVQNIWQVVRWWHHQLTHLHIHIDWSRNVLWKIQSVITSLFFNRFSSGFHCYVWTIFTLSSKIKLNLLWNSSLTASSRFQNVNLFCQRASERQSIARNFFLLSLVCKQWCNEHKYFINKLNKFIQFLKLLSFYNWRVSSQNDLNPFWSIWDIWDLSCWHIKKIIRNL